MQDLYLKFPDKATADSHLFYQVPTQWDAEGNPIAWDTRQTYFNTDVIGMIYEGGEWDPEGNMISPPVPLEGWHVNIRLMPDEDGALLAPYCVEPRHPRRVWA